MLVNIIKWESEGIQTESVVLHFSDETYAISEAIKSKIDDKTTY